MSTLKLYVGAALFVTLSPLLSACAAYQTSGVSPASSRLASVTTASGTVLIFDTLPAPQISGDTIYGRKDGVPCAIPVSDVAATRWVAASGAQAATRATAGHGRPAGLELAAVGQGAHVRITAPSLGWNAATKDVAEVHGDTLLVRRTGGLLAIIPLPWGHILSPTPVPLSSVAKLEVSRNHGEHVTALVLGGLAGMVAGGFAGYALHGSCPSSSSGLDFRPLGCAIEGAGAVMLGMAVGDGVGLLIANAAVPERWTPIGLPGARASLVPLPSGHLGLGVSLAF
jgi:hypothetical protein